MKFQCLYCNYETNHRGTYDRHTSTLKHHKNRKKSCQNSKKSCQNGKKSCQNGKKSCQKTRNYTIFEENKKKSKYFCDFCLYLTNNKTNYDNHLKTKQHKHIQQVISLYENKNIILTQQLELKDKIIEAKNKEIKESKNELEKVVNEHNQRIREYEKEIEYLKEIKSICKKGNKSPMQIIINNYNEAPNFVPPILDEMPNKVFKEYIDMGIPRGIVKMMKEYYVDDIPKEQRSLWCVDQSRLKYLIRKDNKWQTDMMGQILKNDIIPPIKDKLVVLTNNENNKDDTMNEFIRKVESVIKIGKQKNQNRLMKEMSNLFLYDTN